MYQNQERKIRSLIESLDEELLLLRQQCKLPLYAHVMSVETIPTTTMATSKMTSADNSLLYAKSSNNPETGGVIQSRTLANIYRTKVIDAYRGRRIFTVYGNYNTVRRALLRRGWLEKLPPGRFSKLQGLSENVLLQHARRGNEYETVAISKIINHFPSFFVWQPKGFTDTYVDVLPYRNRVRRSRNLDFSTKVGLIGCAEQAQWHQQDGVAAMSYPRFYRLGGGGEERDAFVYDFRQTQCRSLLRLIAEHGDVLEDLIDEMGTVLLVPTVDFALRQVKQQLNDMEHCMLDDEHGCGSTGAMHETTNCPEWQTFLTNSRQILQGTAKFKANMAEMRTIAMSAKITISKLLDRRPDYAWDGCRNLWILKPGYQCRGIGIVIRNTLNDILQWTAANVNRRYIAQKYVERPLLIYRTKFDIRQYMLLVIGSASVCIWMYRDCYLRFSSQEFTIEDLRESIHLTNNSVQKKYKNKPSRDARLPKCNMWSLQQFQVYLTAKEAPERTWEDRIYAGFRQNLIAVVLASLDETVLTENAFELYGCDFMLDDHYNPILIEVNSTPDMSPSTEVTAHICPRALNDLVKVIVDRSHNPLASTGNFELVYEVDYKNHNHRAEYLQHNDAPTLDVNGKAAILHKPGTRYSIRWPFLYKNRGGKLLETSTRPTKNSGVVALVKSPPIRYRRMKMQGSKSEEKKSLMPNSSNKTASGRMVIGTDGKLKAFAKEALALRYTQPK